MLLLDSKQPSPCWIFSYPRTGSSYLAGILNYTGQFHPIISEWLNPRGERNHQTVRWEPWKTIPFEAIENSVEPLLSNLPPNLKIHYFDYEEFFEKEHLTEIMERIPHLKLIRLRRRDAIAATASYYLTQYTKVSFVMSKEEVKNHAKIQVPVDEEQLWKYYEWIAWWDKGSGELLKDTPHKEVFYEDLMKDESQIYDMHNYLNIHPNSTKRGISKASDKKMQHPQTPMIKDVLRKLINERNS